MLNPQACPRSKTCLAAGLATPRFQTARDPTKPKPLNFPKGLNLIFLKGLTLNPKPKAPELPKWLNPEP